MNDPKNFALALFQNVCYVKFMKLGHRFLQTPTPLRMRGALGIAREEHGALSLNA